MNEIFFNCEGFEWDEGNSEKNRIRQNVMHGECEQVFFNEPIMVFSDIKHSLEESRWFLLGKTDAEKFLFVIFTVRSKMIRIISARDMNKKEREVYNERA